LIDRNKVTLTSELTKAIEVGEDHILMVQETEGIMNYELSRSGGVGEWGSGEVVSSP
jgi:hypothetical protein